MGTWGTGPFSSDGALDLLDELAELTEAERLARLDQMFTVLAQDPQALMTEVFPDEIVAAAALVAVSLPGGAEIAAAQPEAVADELAAASFRAPAVGLAAAALAALLTVAGPGGVWLSGWVNAQKQESAARTAEGIRVVLASAAAA